MALESVSKTNRTKEELDRADRINELLLQAEAIADLIGHVDADGLRDSTLNNASWALQNMIAEVRTMARG